MKKKQLINERKRFLKIAGLLKEARTPSYGGTDTLPDFEFEANGKDYIAKLTVDFYYDWDSEDGVYNYQQTVSVHSLGVAQGDEYLDVTDRNEIANIENLLNTDSKLSSRIENSIDIDDAEKEVDDRFDDYDLEEDSDYNMGTPSGDTDAMGDTDAVNIGEGVATYNDLNSVIDLLAFLESYMSRRADTEDDADDEGNYGMNKEARFAEDISDAIEYLQSINK